MIFSMKNFFHDNAFKCQFLVKLILNSFFQANINLLYSFQNSSFTPLPQVFFALHFGFCLFFYDKMPKLNIHWLIFYMDKHHQTNLYFYSIFLYNVAYHFAPPYPSTPPYLSAPPYPSAPDSYFVKALEMKIYHQKFHHLHIFLCLSCYQ